MEPKPQVVPIPILGRVGHGSIERAFCGLAHEFARLQFANQVPSLSAHTECRYYHDGRCGLCADSDLCLMLCPGDSTWQVVYHSVKQRAEYRPRSLRHLFGTGFLTFPVPVAFRAGSDTV